MQVFTKNQAIEQMMAGKKMTHPFMIDGEWVTIENGAIVSEDGVKHMNFFELRHDHQWDDGWTVWEPKQEAGPVPEREGVDFLRNMEILAEMIKNGKDIRMSNQFFSVQSNKLGGGEISMAVDRKAIQDLMKLDLLGNSKYFFQLFMVKKEEYDEIANA